eukprot:6739617-Lingulodinium_polyedra.AAC.1
MMPTCFGGFGLRLPHGAGAFEAMFWASYDLHAAVVPRLADGLGVACQAEHPDAAVAADACTVLASLGVAVAKGAR